MFSSFFCGCYFSFALQRRCRSLLVVFFFLFENVTVGALGVTKWLPYLPTNANKQDISTNSLHFIYLFFQILLYLCINIFTLISRSHGELLFLTLTFVEVFLIYLKAWCSISFSKACCRSDKGWISFIKCFEP